MGVMNKLGTKGKNANYMNADAIQKCISYITRTGGTKIGAEDILSYGGIGVTNNDPEQAVIDMIDVKKGHGKQSGRQMYHYSFTINEEQYGTLGCCEEAFEMAVKKMGNELFYSEGFQVEYAIHRNSGENEGALHAHFVVNSVNYCNGKKYHSEQGEYIRFNQISNQIMDGVAAMCPVHFTDLSKIRLE